MSKTIQFSVGEKKHQEMVAHAEQKGFRTASDLARYATVQHMRRYPASGHGKGRNGVGAVQPNEPGAVPETVTEDLVG